jgi:alpha-1,6-mannosyltransferase
LMLWISRDPAFERLSHKQVLLAAALIAIAGMSAQPLLEDDHFRYLWDGYITARFGTPYSLAPSAFFGDDNIPAAMQDVLSGINHPEVPTIYGPVLQFIFAIAYWLAPAALWPLKLLLCIAVLAMVFLLHAARIKPRWLLILVLHPLVVKETALSAHPDLFIGLALLAAVVAWQRGAQVWAGIAVSLAVAMKLSVLAVLPLFCIDRQGHFSWRATAAMVLTLCAVYAPAWLSRAGSEGYGLVALGAQWIFNPLLFKLVSTVMSHGAARLVVLLLWIRQLRQRPMDAAESVAQHWPFPPVLPVLLVLLLLSPVVNPWYWLWLLPLAVIRFSWGVWTAATLSLLAYAHVAQALNQQVAFTDFAVPLWATGLQLVGILAAIAFDVLSGRKRRERK